MSRRNDPLKKIRTLIIDDSALVRQAVSSILSRDPEIEVVGTAVDPYAAKEKILALNPDVLTLDIEMPRMDGITFLKVLMKHRPMPVVVMSSLAAAGSEKALEALQAGAVDVIGKPGGAFSTPTDGSDLIARIKAAAHARILPLGAIPPAPPVPRSPLPKVNATPRAVGDRRLILMGASTGGTEALKVVLSALPAGLPPICIVQHIPAYFSGAFARRLNELCPFEVREARHGETLEPNLALVAPGGSHLLMRWAGTHYISALSDGPMVHYQRPSVDVMFDSALKTGAAPDTLGVLLTGMGSDGAAGLRGLREAGSTTLVQNEETCVVFGMPREAIKLGAASMVLPLNSMANHIISWANATADQASGRNAHPARV